MDEKTPHNETADTPRISRKAQIIVLVTFCLIAIATIGLTAWSIVSSTKDSKPGLQYGVGANGFRAFVEEDGNLGVNLIVNKKQVISALGNLAKSVGDSQVEKVFNYNGNQGQTITFPFVRTDGTKASLYIDKRVYKSSQAMTDDHIYQATLKAGVVNGRQLYYREAQTIGTDREYSLMIVDGVMVYRFVIAQPFTNITISEIESLAALKKLSAVANL